MHSPKIKPNRPKMAAKKKALTGLIIMAMMMVATKSVIMLHLRP